MVDLSVGLPVSGPPQSLLSWIKENSYLYPFQSHSLNIGQCNLHYIDEGDGSPVFMIHGNPTWSFFYRNLAQTISKHHRVIVPDHIGCGLSDRPTDKQYNYTLQSRINDLDQLIKHIAPVGKVSLVVHDWGGMIGTSWAVRNSERVKNIVFLNTAGFALPKGKPLPWTLKCCRSSFLGPILVQGLNAFCLGAAKYGAIKGLNTKVKTGFLKPYSTWKDRLAVLRFVQDIPLSPSDPSYSIVESTREQLFKLNNISKMFCWGRHDFIFNDDFLLEWKKYFPDANYHIYEDAGHYLLEDASAPISAKINDFLLNNLGD